MIDESILQRHPHNVRRIVRFLDSGHLSPSLRHIVQPFEDLAANFLHKVPTTPATVTALHKIVDAKDAAVRAAIDAQENNAQHIQPGESRDPNLSHNPAQ